MYAVPDRAKRAIAASATRRDPFIFVVDDDLSVRESLRGLLECEGWQVETFTSASEFLARARTSGPSCLLLDVDLPGLGGLDLQQCVARDRPELPIIFITGHGDVPTSVRAMKAGAADFLTKPLRTSRLLGAIGLALERSRVTLELETGLTELRERYALLTPREREVMHWVVEGGMNREIATRLGIREITVKVHRGRVMEKMRATSLPHLVTLAARLALPVEPPLLVPTAPKPSRTPS